MIILFMILLIFHEKWPTWFIPLADKCGVCR